MDFFDIVTFIAAAFCLVALLTVLHRSWQLLLLSVGIVLINKFTIWAAVFIYAVSASMILYEPKTKGRRKDITLFDALIKGLEATIGIIIVAWIVGMFFSV